MATEILSRSHPRLQGMADMIDTPPEIPQAFCGACNEKYEECSCNETEKLWAAQLILSHVMEANEQGLYYGDF